MGKFFNNLIRVWKVTRKPTKEEYFQVLKIVFYGFLVIGVIGFIIELIWRIFLSSLFGGK